jgi:shikimate kinase
MNKVYVVGLPASGKTWTGRWLANKLGWEFVDLDSLIESKAKETISNIFNINGEDYFRALESEVLRETSQKENCVISTGGGTASHTDNIDWMNAEGLTLYLNTNKETITERIILENDKRPMFQDLKGAEIADYLEELHKFRKKFYSKSKIVYNKTEISESLHFAVNQLVSIYSEV